MTAPTIQEEAQTSTVHKRPSKWKVFIDNDPVNTMSYVTRIIRKIFGYDETKASQIMLEVHHKGKGMAWVGDKETAEAYLLSLQKAQLNSHLEEVSDE